MRYGRIVIGCGVLNSGCADETVRMIERDVRREDLDRDVAIEAAVARVVDFAHPAGADGEDFVGTEPCSGRERHEEAAPVVH
jgi:hypothetical protein